MKKILLYFLVLSTAIFACKNDDDDDDEPQKETLTLNITGLEALGTSYKYEGWIVVNGTPKSTGIFTVNSNGDLAPTTFMVNSSDLANATEFIVTIEPSPDGDPDPANTKILSGDFSGSSANLTTDIVGDFTDATGKFILATPTTAATDDENSGVWFLDPSSGTPIAGLSNLPTLPAGWIFEGWAVIEGTPVTTGTFSSETGADNEAPYSGTEPGPPFPGEDFINDAPAGLTFPTDLSGDVIVVTIEPVPDNSDGPFTLKPLSGNVPSGATTQVPYAMSNQSGTFPTGTAKR